MQDDDVDDGDELPLGEDGREVQEQDEDDAIVLLKESEGIRCDITSYPPAGDSSLTYVEGVLDCASPGDYKIITLIRVGSIYGPKPFFDDPYATVLDSGLFQAEFVTVGEDGDFDCTEIYLYFVPKDYAHEIEVGDDYAVRNIATAKLLEDSVYALKIVR